MTTQAIAQSPGSKQIINVTGESSGQVLHLPWQFFTNCQICVQLAGDATDMTATVIRSVLDPSAPDAVWAPADSTGFSGNLSGGIPPNVYVEPGAAWWSVIVTGITGGSVQASMSGQV